MDGPLVYIDVLAVNGDGEAAQDHRHVPEGDREGNECEAILPRRRAVALM
jgi:hypothetical protein